MAQSRLEIKQKLQETMASFCNRVLRWVSMKSNAVNEQTKLRKERGREIIWMISTGSFWTIKACSWIVNCGAASPTASKNAATFDSIPCSSRLSVLPIIKKPFYLVLLFLVDQSSCSKRWKLAVLLLLGRKVWNPKSYFEFHRCSLLRRHRNSIHWKRTKMHGNIKNTNPIASHVLWPLR